MKNDHTHYKVGDEIIIPIQIDSMLKTNIVTITGFNKEKNIAHWVGDTIIEGMTCHSGVFIDEIIGLKLTTL